MVEAIALHRGHTISSIVTSKSDEKNCTNFDVAIDFSKSEYVFDHLHRYGSQQKNIVIGTTGWSENFAELHAIAEKYQVGILYSPNYSIGMHVYKKVLKETCRWLSANGLYDVAGLEIHHREKQDAPSGTAKELATIVLDHWKTKKNVSYDRPQEKVMDDELQFTSLRIGQEPGTHSLFFDSSMDTITLTHQAKNREGFAIGAILAAEWLHGKKGFYTLEDVFS